MAVSDSGLFMSGVESSELGQAPRYQLKQSLFKSHFKVTPCRFRDLTLIVESGPVPPRQG